MWHGVENRTTCMGIVGLTRPTTFRSPRREGKEGGHHRCGQGAVLLYYCRREELLHSAGTPWDPINQLFSFSILNPRQYTHDTRMVLAWLLLKEEKRKNSRGDSCLAGTKKMKRATGAHNSRQNALSVSLLPTGTGKAFFPLNEFPSIISK